MNHHGDASIRATGLIRPTRRTAVSFPTYGTSVWRPRSASVIVMTAGAAQGGDKADK
jgi:hypothetical protein